MSKKWRRFEVMLPRQFNDGRDVPPEWLSLAVLEIGPEDAAEVVALASPQQFRHFVDLAAWPRRDEGPDARAVLSWLHLAREGGGHSDRARAQGHILRVLLGRVDRLRRNEVEADRCGRNERVIAGSVERVKIRKPACDLR